MSPNRRIFLNIVATYQDRAVGDIDRAQPVRRSLYARTIGLFCGRWAVQGHLPHFRCLWYNTRCLSSLNEPWCESPRRYGVEESLAHIFCYRRVA